MAVAPALYTHHFVDKQEERLELFAAVQEQFGCQRGLYAGSFVHITPSLVIEHMTYVDMDKRCRRFFDDAAARAYVAERRQYAAQPSFDFIEADFSAPLPLQQRSYDLLISLYSGFVSHYCTQYLAPGGVLLVNNSHGDAPLALLNPCYTLCGAVVRNGSSFSIHSAELDGYFQTKSGKPLDRQQIMASMRGPAYTKTAYAYLFCKESDDSQGAVVQPQ